VEYAYDRVFADMQHVSRKEECGRNIMGQPTGIYEPKVNAGRRTRRRGGAAAQYFLGKLYQGTAKDSEIKDIERDVDVDLSDPLLPSATGVILDTYGPEKEEEVKEAFAIAKELDLGDIGMKLEGWRARLGLKGAQGMMNLGAEGLGRRSTPDTESRITGFLTGETGTIEQQKKKLEAKARQGGRRTRKRKTRTAKKSRRNYK
jgi:hypothetical protein